MTKRHILTVVHPFGDYERGAQIEGHAMAEVTKHHRHNVVTTEVDEPDEPEPTPPAKPAAKAS